MKPEQNDWDEDYLRNIDLYTDLYEKHGISPHSLNWGSQESQCRRFEVFSSIGDLHGASILDVGCGLGDFYAWLQEKNLSVEYSGIDITPKMIAAARQRFPGVRFDVLDILSSGGGERKYDYVFASGIFYLVKNSPEEFLLEMVQKMFSFCKVGVAFNSLSSWAKEKEEGEFYADPSATLEICRGMTPYLRLRHDYHPADFSVFLYKDKTRGL